VPNGRVSIRWSLNGDHVHLIWREHGGRSLSDEPRRTGGGTRLLTRVVSAELGVPVRIRIEPTGLVCEFDGPTQKEPAFEAPWPDQALQ